MSNIEPEDIAKLEEKKMNSELFQVEEIDTVIFDKSGTRHDWNGYGVTLKEDPANYCWLMRDKMEADNLCKFLNNECYMDIDAAVDAFVIDNCIEWDNLIRELSQKERALYYKKENYEVLSEEILKEAAKKLAETGEDIIKTKYGGNNDKTRKKYVKDSLAFEKSEIKKLEFSIDYLKRRISYLKGLVTVKTALIDVKKHD